MPNHILWEVMSITTYVVCSCFIHTYIFSKAKRNLLMVGYIGISSSMLLWSVTKLLEIVAPTSEIKTFYLQLQYGLALLFIASLINFSIKIYSKMPLNKNKLISLVVGLLLVIWIVVLSFSRMSMELTTYILVFLFFSVSLTIFFNRYRIFPEIEISLNDIVENVEDRVAVFDLSGNLVDMNLRALQEGLIPMERKTLECFLEKINQYSKQGSLDFDQITLLNDDSYENEICIEIEESITYYVFSAYVIRGREGEKIGTVCTLRDVTENKLISIELDNKNKELQNLNKELRNYIRIVDHLAEEKERAHIACEINNTVGQKLTEVLSVLEVIKLTNSKDSDVYEKPLNEAIESCREVLSEVRVVVSKLIPEK